jgi:putative ABC transport system permease protein
VAIRVARRDARRYKWRSALIVAMVGLPVLLLTSGVTLLATNDVSLAESVPRLMGSAQARIHDGGEGHRLTQSPDGQSWSTDDGKGGVTAALAVPGFSPGSNWTTQKVQRLTGGKVIQTLDAYMRVTLGDRRPSMHVLGIDARDPMAREMTDLVSGRWASTPSEIVVTRAGLLAGLQREGTLTTAGRGGEPQQLTVVGIAIAQTENQEPALLVGLPETVKAVSDPERVSAAFLVGRADPVSWSNVRRLNDYGLHVQSRGVFLNPPPNTELDPRVAQTVSSDQRDLDLVLLLAAVGLFIETTLLAGPAFAVSAARQRRSLALAASNGAEARQLRRYVLGQAVVLGVVSATVAVVVGVLLTFAGLSWWQAGHADFVIGPFEVSWPRVIGVFICAVIASVVAALIPAKGIARLDIVSVLAGRAGDRSVHRGLPAAGMVVMVLSGTGLIWAVAFGGDGVARQGPLIVVGAIGLVVGCLMVIPAVLALVGRLGTHLVLPVRLAARDTARQRGRSTPAVAAIMAAVAALTALSIGAASDTRQKEDDYQPSRPMGTGAIVMNGEDSSERTVRGVLDRFAPQLKVDPVGYVSDRAVPATGRRRVSWVALLPPGCAGAHEVAIADPNDAIGSCGTTDNEASMLMVGGLPGLSAKLALSKPQRAVLQGGGILVTDPRLVRDGQVSSVGGTATQDNTTGVTTGHAITQRTRLPAVVVDPRIWEAAFRGQTSGVWTQTQTARRLGWPVWVDAYNLSSPTGTISPEVEAAVADRLGDGYIVGVERGYQNPYRTVLLIAFLVAGLLVLIASLISTALSLAESQNDMATLAAVGATRHTRRGIAAGQAFVVAACGALLGVAVGMVPGIAITWPLTARTTSPLEGAQGLRAIALPHQGGPVIVIPWLPLIAVCVGVPLLAAGLAWIAVRRHPQMTRRLA